MLDALIVGGDSQIGKALVARLRKDGRQVMATTRKGQFSSEHVVVFNVRWPVIVTTREGETDSLIAFDLRWPTGLPPAHIAFFCTGINGFKPCEADPEEARRINVTLLTAAARQVAAMGTRVVFLSSAAAETHPDTVYGKCKIDAEKVFCELGGACYRLGPVAFPGRKVWANEVYSPINLSTLTALLAGCLERWEPGVHSIYNRNWIPEAA
jgi:dTDP-4-dehydrorhamnose reductase